MNTYRMGRLPHDPIKVANAPQLRGGKFSAVSFVTKLDRSGVDFKPGMFDNDTLPTCSAAGYFNASQMVAAISKYRLTMNPAMAPLFYASCVGCAPTPAAMAATDGAVLLDVLIRQGRAGVDIGGPTPLVGLFGAVPLNQQMLAKAMALLMNLYIGVSLRERDMEGADVWDAVPGADDGKILGGHCMVGFDYQSLFDTGIVRVATWGMLQKVTWRWLMARLDEAYSIFWRQLFVPTVVNIDALEADLNGFSSGY